MRVQAFAVLRATKPLPERPRKPGGPTPPEADAAAAQAKARKEADEQHAAWAREKAKIDEIDDPDARTQATADWFRRHKGRGR
jgi:hypothetical protein